MRYVLQFIQKHWRRYIVVFVSLNIYKKSVKSIMHSKDVRRFPSILTLVKIVKSFDVNIFKFENHKFHEACCSWNLSRQDCLSKDESWINWVIFYALRYCNRILFSIFTNLRWHWLRIPSRLYNLCIGDQQNPRNEFNAPVFTNAFHSQYRRPRTKRLHGFGRTIFYGWVFQSKRSNQNARWDFCQNGNETKTN